MLRFLGILGLCLAASQSVWAGRISLKNLDFQEDFVLQDRLRRMAVIESASIAGCTDRQARGHLANVRKLESLPDFSKLEKSAQKNYILDLIKALRTTSLLARHCGGGASAKDGRISSIRHPLLPSLRTADQVQHQNFYLGLAPACYPVAGQGALAQKDSNACFGADKLIFKDARDLGLSLPKDALQFSQALYEALLKKKPQESIDLFSVFANQSSSPTPKHMLTLLASFSTSGNSGLTGWLQGVEDTLLVGDLNDQTLSANDVYARSKDLQLAKITYQRFREVADRFSATLRIFGVEVKDWNRHNFMAAYLGCRDNGTRSQAIRKVGSIGVGYESKDFVSHLREGSRLRPSIENFQQDTKRYVDGAALGWDACH